jgi:VWFA-related protein
MIPGRWRELLASCVALATWVGPVAPSQAQEQAPAPLDVGLEEQVEVQLVLVDFLVLDRNERIVPDLTIDDFDLEVGGRDTEIHSLDLDCPVGDAPEPLPGKYSVTLHSAPTERPRRIVIVFDYYHMTNTAEAFDQAQLMLDKWPVGGEEHMVISLGEVVRVESPFTTDIEDVRWALQRMRNDPDLYGGNYGRLTERRFFDRIEILFDLLERWEGRKSIVLFSGPFLNDGFFRDPEFKLLSALAVVTRTAVYPMDTGGLRTLVDPNVQPFGGPPMLRRLANETGGRMTSETNEIGVAYAKAHRDLGCTYTIGFYDPDSRRDKERRLTIYLKNRGGKRVVYPEFYLVRSREKKRKSLFRSAAMVPQMFESERMNADLFLLEPSSSSRWRALLAVEVRVGPEAFLEPGEEWELNARVRKTNGTVLHSFKKKIPMPETDPATGMTPMVTVFHELRIRPGRYVVSAVLSDPDAETPLAASRPAVVAEIPRGEPFLVGPILGRRPETAGDEGGTRRRDHPEFEPLLEPSTERGESLESLTVVCAVGDETVGDIGEIVREITTWDGLDAQSFEPASFRLPVEGKVRCHALVDRVETDTLEPGRYELTAVAETSNYVRGRGSVEFTILPLLTE